MNKIKTRFAPSPTGDLHIGGLRTALYSYLFAKKNGGEFYLRIEDTDQARYKEGSVETIIEGLKWAGLKHDNTELVYQSKRKELYQKYTQQLIDQGDAYYCFCSSERLEQMRNEQTANKQAPRYDRQCLGLNADEIKQKLDTGEKYVVRMKIPEGKTKFTDLVRGEVEFDHKEMDDQVLMKSDGLPTYHLANVVDDHDMEISHVIRAEEWLPSTPKHLLLYKMFQWEAPEYAHLSMILAPDKSKLSKRHGATSVLEFRNLGYLPEAVVNYISLLGWNPGDEREIFSLAELEKEFDLTKVNKAGAIFDIEKLDWMNGHYIRQKSQEELMTLGLPYLQEKYGEALKAYSDDYIKAVIGLEQERMKKISDIALNVKYFFGKPEYMAELLVWKKSDKAETKSRLEFLINFLNEVPETNWTRSALEESLIAEIKQQGFGNGDTLWPMRTALSGEERSPSPFEIAEVLGKAETIKRLKEAVEKLGN